MIKNWLGSWIYPFASKIIIFTCREKFSWLLSCNFILVLMHCWFRWWLVCPLLDTQPLPEVKQFNIIKAILSCSPCIKMPSINPQVILLSATMPTEVLDVTTRFMREPIQILVRKEELTLEGIRQFYVNVEREVRSWLQNMMTSGGRLNKKDGLTRYGNSHVKDKTS